MKRLILFVLACGMLAGCNEKISVSAYQVEAPAINTFAPTQGVVGTQVTIQGTHLDRIDSAWIGGVLVPLRYRVSTDELVIEVSSGTKSGPIIVKNSAGSAQSENIFTMQYLVPEVDEWPQMGTVYQQVVLEGKNMNTITQVKLGDLEANIVAKHATELVFEVPFRDDETPVAIRLVYYNEEGAQEIGPKGETFVIEKQSPIISSCPTSLTKYTPISITGEMLTLFDSLKVGDERVLIKSKNDEEMIIDMPTNYFGGEMTADLIGWYYGVKQKVICPNFTVISDPNEPRYYTYKNIVLSGRTASGGSEMPFFDGETGSVISSCEALDQMMAIDFMLYDNSGYAQLYSPSNATNTLKNFKCEGISIVTDASVWAAFYKVDTKFRVLDPANTLHKAVIDQYEAGTIVSLDDAFFEGISVPSSKAPKVYQTDSSNSNISVDNYPYAWIRNFATEKDGILKVTNTKYNETSGKTYEITIDIIWEK